jgi:hypothetical protein
MPYPEANEVNTIPASLNVNGSRCELSSKTPELASEGRETDCTYHIWWDMNEVKVVGKIYRNSPSESRRGGETQGETCLSRSSKRSREEKLLTVLLTVSQ